MFFKRRSRANSYVDESDSPNSKYDKYDSKYEKYDRPPSVRQDSAPRLDGHNEQTPLSAAEAKEANMYPRSSQPTDAYSAQRPLNGGHNAMSPMDSGMGGMGGGLGTPVKAEPMPDLLAQAFNQAVRPYTDKIDQLEGQIADLNAWIEGLESQRAEVHAWIDKRGLRPDVPPSIAKTMDAADPSAATTLNAQLDRKITIVNFDLHRLQDDLNDSISAAHFASAMSKFLPDIARLASLPTGSKHAFDLVLKLGGNLNSHVGLDQGEPEDIAARRDFYGKLDVAMVEVVRRRFAEEGEDWPVQREIKRIEKTAAFLRNYGVEPYFPSTLDVMERKVADTPPRYT
ncbi:hypothetical protein K490DRAFT_31043 [Saccharata proteae CBS 121410]|uniref:Uncharacterized protein n=1 Tax=Saccharata proteae CBS 121410 TaxID=1314787 RepID=A0A9P4I3B0_9PEZI|nr:hypothetical protein K490DRAFT_31043 [Saccharata proteae CBS 121410]